MRISADGERLLDASSILGITVGSGMLLSAFLVPELGLLAVPAFLVLVISLLCGTR